MKTPDEINKIIIELLDKQNYSVVQEFITKQWEESERNNHLNKPILIEIAGAFISLGDESKDIELVNKGKNIFQTYHEDIIKISGEVSINYNLGKAYSALYRINSEKVENFFPTPENISGNQIEAKQHYLRAYKKIRSNKLNKDTIDIVNNLGNNLADSGRYIEALQLFDECLNRFPNFIESLISKADLLDHLLENKIIREPVSLLSVYSMYHTSAKLSIPNKEIKTRVEEWIKKFESIMISNNLDPKAIIEEFNNNHITDQNDSIYSKFKKDNFLTLSEHSLFCKCSAGSVEDLLIGFPGLIVRNEKIVLLELLNNRMKSEFELARQLFFEYNTQSSNETTEYMHYENLIPGILNGVLNEKLRTSFRLCFGILDKIAEGICYMLDLKFTSKDNIYFHDFWNSKKDPDRWKKINQIQNIHLTALYSIANDLNKNEGEFGYYKEWRNKLEHGLFNILNQSLNQKDINILEQETFCKHEMINSFEHSTKHLLQITRAAILSFVWCIREELIKD